MSIVRSSLLLSFIDKYAVLAINIVSTMILARRLTPAETGVFSIAWSLINIAQALREFGIFGYIVQEKELTRDRLATAATISITLGLVLTGTFFATAGAIARFYADPRLEILVRILSFNFLVVAFASVGTALLQRAMNFRATMRINVVSAAINAATSVGMVLVGYGPAALAWASLAGNAALFLCNLPYVGRQILLLPSLHAWRRIGEFGLLSSGAALLNATSGRVADLTIGRLLGIEAVGIFSRGSGLITLFQQSLMQAVLPVTGAALAQSHREDRDVPAQFLLGVCFITGVAWPMLTMMGLLAHPIIIVFFGAQWLRAIPIAQVLCMATALGIIANLTSILFSSIGAIRQNFAAQSITLPVYIAAVVVGSTFSLHAAAVGVAVAGLVSSHIAVVFLGRKFGISWLDVLRAVARSAAVTAVTALAPLIVISRWSIAEGDDRWWAAIAAAIGGGVFWLGALRLARHPLYEQMVSAAMALRSRMLRRSLAEAP